MAGLSPRVLPPRTDTTRKQIAHNVLTILINISSDPQVLSSLAEDDAFLETLLLRVTVCQSPHFPRCPEHENDKAVLISSDRTPKNPMGTGWPCCWPT